MIFKRVKNCKTLNPLLLLTVIILSLTSCFSADPLIVALKASDWQRVYEITLKKDRSNDIVAQRLYLKSCMATNRSYLTPDLHATFIEQLESDDDEKWREWTKDALDENPHHPVFLYLYADGMSLHIGRKDIPLKYYSMSIAIDTGFVLAIADRAKLYRRMSKDSLALADLQRAIGLDESNPYPHIAWAISSRNYDDMRGYCDSALRIKPTHTEALFCMSQALWGSENYSDAVPYLERALEQSSWDLGIAFELGRLYGINGDRWKAIDTYNEIIERATTFDSAFIRAALEELETHKHKQ